MNRRAVLIGALLASVALNLLFVGVLVGKAAGRASGPPPGAWAARDLSPESRRVVRRHMRRELASVRPLRAQMRNAREEVRRAALAEEFDPGALRAALAQLRATGDRYQELLHENLVEVAGELPAGERSALVRAALARGRPAAAERPPRREGSGP